VTLTSHPLNYISMFSNNTKNKPMKSGKLSFFRVLGVGLVTLASLFNYSIAQCTIPAFQTVVPLDQEICINTSANIQINGSEVGMDYYLRLDSDNSIIAGPVAGTGGALIFNTGNLAVSTDFNVVAVDPTGFGALDFDGTNEHVQMANGLLSGVTDFTFECWFNTDVNNGWARLMDFGNSTTVYAFLTPSLGGTNIPRFAINIGGGEQQITAPSALAQGTWYHIAVTIDASTTTGTMYIDGAQVAQNTSMTLTPSSMGVTTNNWFGRSQFGVDPFLNGKMDEIRIWNVTRTATEISNSYDNCLSGSEPGLLTYLKLNDAAGSAIASDASLAGNDGTLVNMNTTTAWVTGVAPCSSCETEMSQIATVRIDETDPVAVCQDVNLYLTGAGTATLLTSDVNNGSSDFCPVILSLSRTAFSCSDVLLSGLTSTLTVTDNNGNSATCVSLISVFDTIRPIASCQDITVQLDVDGNYTMAASEIDGGSTDNCPLTLSASQTAFNCGMVGDNSITLTLSDASSNSATCVAIVTVEDNVGPTAVCQDITVQLDGTGNASITTGDVDNGSADACGINTLALDITTFDCTNVGGNSVVLTVTDNNSNSSNCSATVTVEDNVGPTAVCQDITAQLDIDGNVTITPAQIDNGSTDNCGIASLTLDIADFDCTDVGGNSVVLTVTDDNGNTATCTSTVNVEDNVGPTAVCQNTTVVLDGSGNGSITTGDIDNGSTDACGIATMTLDNSSFTCANLGSNTVVLTVTDVNSNTSTCSATVTVQDNMAPTATCQDFTVNLDGTGNASITTANINNGSTDNCAIASLSLDITNFNCSNVGPNTVTLTVTDTSGNTSSCTSTVTVQDTQAPIVTCPSNITQNVVPNTCGRIINYNVSASDNCAFTNTQTDGTGYTSGDLFYVGTTLQSYNVVDASGNTTVCSFNVTIVDNQLPSITGCPSSRIVNTQAGVCQAVVNWIQPTASDNCPGVTFATTHGPGSTFPLGTTTVTYTATDASGNSATCSFNVTVVDNQAPVFTSCPPNIAISNDPGVCSGATALGSPTVTDNCSVASVVASSTGPFPVGTTVVTWTATDGSGNTSTCTQNVNVVDDEAPIANCAPFTLQLDAAGNGTLTGNDIDNVSTDNCGIASLTPSQTSFDCTNVGSNTVTLTVEDIHGNTSTCSTTVTVEDNIDPVATCQPFTAQLDSDGNVTVTGNDVDNSSSDACGIASLVVSPNTFTCGEVGGNTVTLTVTDNNGNTATCSTTVTVEDNVGPTAVCQDITVQLDGTGNETIIPAQIDNGSADACGIASITVSPNAFTCADLGGNSVVLTVTDVNSNISTCNATVTVEDNISPLAVCQNITAQLDVTGNVTVPGADVDGGSTDACGPLTFTLDPNSFTCADIGNNNVILTVTDIAGNTATCAAVITVEDNVAPDITCANIIVDLDASGDATITPGQIVGGYVIDQTGTYAPMASPITGTPVSLLDDELSAALPIGFNFDFFGTSYSNFYISSNGFITFSPQPDGCCSGQSLPDPVGPNHLIAFAWEDLDPGNGGQPAANLIQYTTTGVAPNRVLISEFFNVDHFVNGNNVTTQVMLYETSNIIEIHTTNMPSDGGDHTQGIENLNGTIAYTVPGRNASDWSISNDYVAFIPLTAQASDACGIVSTTVDNDTFDCSNVGSNTVTVTVTDSNGNSATCTSNVTVRDTVKPTVTCNDFTVALDAGGNATITTNDIGGLTAADACGIAGVSAQTTFDCSNVGDNTVTLTATDVNGNTGTCDAIVTVEDNIAPTITCPGDVTVSNDPGVCEAVVTYADPIIADNCGASTTEIYYIPLSQITSYENLGGPDCNGTGADFYSCGGADIEFTWNSLGSGSVSSVNVELFNTWNANATLSTTFNGSGDNPLNYGGPYGGCMNNLETISLNSGNYNVGGINNFALNLSGMSCFVLDENPDAGWNPNSYARVIVNYAGSVLTQTDATGLSSGDAFPVGTTTLEYTVTDGSGNTATCSFDVTVEDTEVPNALCNNPTIQLDVNGNATITVGDIDNSSTDNCAVATTSIDVTTFNCANVGGNTVVLTVVDIHGNTSTCNSTVTVEDNVGPTAVCQDITVQLDGTGNTTITGAQIDNGSDDACGVASLSVTPNAFTCADLGGNSVVLTVTDNNGNSTTCSSTVTVEDNMGPTAICQDIIVQLDIDGNVSITPAQVDNGSGDACGLSSLTLDITDFTCSEVGGNTVVLTVTDAGGNTASCTAIVTVEDNVGPTAVCQDITVQLDGSGNASIVPTDIDNGSTDACGVANLTLDITTFDCSDLGANTVILTVEDVNGNTSTCSSTVTVEDNVPPVITCPADLTVSADPGVCQASSVAYGTATAVDNCTVTSTVTNNAPLVFPLGNTTVTWTAADAFGNTSTCDQIVTVVDSENPVISCPADVVVNNDPGVCNASSVTTGTATATDNCSSFTSLTVSSDAPATFPLGVTNVTWTATDGAGNTHTCVQRVTVVDNEAPMVNCPTDVTVDTDSGSCSASGVSLGSPVATDNCSIASTTNNGLMSYPLGTTVVTWTVTDAAGNTASCNQNVTVVDTQAPSIFCPANQTVAADPGVCTASSVALGTPLTSDNCTVAGFTNNSPGVFPVGVTTVTWTVTDGSGNTTSCNQYITVVDNQNPTIACAGPVTVNNDPGTCGSSSVVLVNPTANDNCGTVTLSNNAPSTYPVGSTTVTWTATDNVGNIATCTQVVTVVDNQAPTITCPTDRTVGTAGGSCNVSSVSLGTPTTADNCSVASVTNDGLATYPLGTTVVTWTVTDVNGNTASCTQNVNVVDNEAPQINCPSNVLVNADPGTCVATGVTLGTATGSDNCTLMSITNNNPGTYPLGLTTVTWTATDAAGNTRSCTQTVNVVDNQLPTIACPGPVTVSADAGTCSATGVVLGTPATNDNCFVASVTSNAPATFPLGNTTVTWTVVDGSGNSRTCTQLVTVTDNELPTIACSGDVTIPMNPGTCVGTTTLTAPVTSDNCSVASVTNDAPATYPAGTTTVTWTVTDGSGNTATCAQLVTVVDTEAPTITCPTNITASTDPGVCSATIAIGSPTVNDNCGIASVTNNAPATFPRGTTVVTWTVTDNGGNTATCTQTIVVEDNEAPLITCPGNITVNNVPGNCGRNVSYAAPAIMDNCNITAMTQTDGTGLTSGSWFPIGTSLQEYTVVDEAGNSVSCSFTVTVDDNQAPVITNCPTDMTVYSTATTCNVVVNYGSPVISDNCPGTVVTSSHNSGESFPVGVTTVTYTATDSYGNASNCTFDITVLDTVSPVAPTLASVEGGCAVTLPTPTAPDNCSGNVPGTTSTVFPITTVGVTPVTWTFTDANGNTSTVVQYVTIDGNVDATVSYQDNYTLISNNTIPGVTYQWINCATGLPIAGATGISYTAPINGSYAVQVTEPGCPSATSICYPINTTGLDDVTIENLIVYPNPSTDGIFTIKFEGDIDKVEVLDVLGRVITVPMAYDNKYVDGSELANGKYMLRIYTDNGVTTKEVIIINK